MWLYRTPIRVPSSAGRKDSPQIDGIASVRGPQWGAPVASDSYSHRKSTMQLHSYSEATSPSFSRGVSGYTFRPVLSQNSTTASYDHTRPTLSLATGDGKPAFCATAIARFLLTPNNWASSAMATTRGDELINAP